MKAAVITFPGSNCDDDCVYTLKTSGFEVSSLWHKDTPDLSGFNLIVVPGGFSYGDYLRCGAIAAQSPIMEAVKKFAAAGGHVLGICNGFQILCEAALLPGALARNRGLEFICKDILLKVEANSNPWLGGMKIAETLTLPIAHGDGRYIVDQTQYEELKKNEQILLSYATSNPNGSTHAIAGVCNQAKNVFGLMPHPERATDLRSRDGQKIWAGVITRLQEARS